MEGGNASWRVVMHFGRWECIVKGGNALQRVVVCRGG